MKRNFRLTYEAETDLALITRHIATDNPKAASRFLESFEHACELLVTMPEIGHPRAFAHLDLEGLRSWPIKGFEKYLVFYRVAAGKLEVVRVLHGARDLPALFGEGERWERGLTIRRAAASASSSTSIRHAGTHLLRTDRYMD